MKQKAQQISRRTLIATTAMAAQAANPDHEKHMRRAIELAANVPKYPFGALLVETATGRIVAEGWNRSTDDPTFHGEMDAIHTCAKIKPKVDWAKLTLYTTAEPCPMCMSAALWAGIGVVVYGTSIEYLKKLKWWQVDIRAEEVRRRTNFRNSVLLGGVLEQECNRLFDAALKL
jgi:tRNA(adenine34) deaminase